MNAARSHPTLSRACADIAALGLHISEEPLPGAVRYLVLGARSNARWWLIPLVTRRSAASGFALFQPQLVGARVMKALGVAAAVCGLPLLARRSSTWSLSGESTLARHFTEARRPVFAYFTGTDGPHRKITVQVMDDDGTILGYAKSSSEPVVRELIVREARALTRLQQLGLRSALVPALRFAGDIDGTYLLATDTRKTFWTVSDRTYGAAHRAFLQELFQKTHRSAASAGGFAAALGVRWEAVRSRVQREWQERIAKTLGALDRHDRTPLQVCLGHGDFTPWNTYRVDQRLYVFDWEYADENAAAGTDAIHFIHNQPRLWHASAAARMRASQAELNRLFPEADAASVHATHLIYGLTQTLQVIEKMALRPGTVSAWDGCTSQAALLDHLLATS
jgi:hypothetical protein